jgi:hypothetical protein
MQSRKNPRHLYQRRELKPDEKPANLVLQFNPRPAVDMLVACLWDRWSGSGAPDLWSFAGVTDEPPPEIAATGDRRHRSPAVHLLRASHCGLIGQQCVCYVSWSHVC